MGHLVEFKLLQLKAYDIILGHDWIKQHSPIGLNLRAPSRHLTVQKDVVKKVAFNDFTAPTNGPLINAYQLDKVCITDIIGYVTQINLLQQPILQDASDMVPLDIATLLEEFACIFTDNYALPLHRDCDHEIPLKEGAKPPNIRTYRVPHKQKDEVERLIKTMLQDTIIRPSSSSYSSQSILVRKKDGSSRLCIDYRELNSQIVKDKFPIPVIEDLLDELYGAEIFTKLDLRSGYHQI
jgi:hypothetical protein